MLMTIRCALLERHFFFFAIFAAADVRDGERARAPRCAIFAAAAAERAARLRAYGGALMMRRCRAAPAYDASA